MNPHQVTRDFEEALCNYTGAPLAVATTSCTMAITLALAWHAIHTYGGDGWPLDHALPQLTMPRLSYVGVPAAVRNACWIPRFRDEDWQGEYEFKTLERLSIDVWDSARRFTSGMYRCGTMQCVSFHWSKILGLSQGGAILLDDMDAYLWLLKARFDGRTPGIDAKHDQVTYPSWHAYLSPEVAAHGLMKLSLLPKHNADLPRSDYPDLSTLEAFK